jgi:hypothetical protein
MKKENMWKMFANDLLNMLEEYKTTYQIVRDLISLGYDYDTLVAVGFDMYIVEEAMHNDMNNEE